MKHQRSVDLASIWTLQALPRVAVVGAGIAGPTIVASSSGWAGLAASSPLPVRLVSDLRTDHAGETGAVMVYRGILATTRDAAVRRFASRHLPTEADHLAAIERLLAPRHHSRLLPLWRAAGWLTGALPAWVGPRAVYATIEAVETFVDHHYTEQIKLIDQRDPGREQAPLQAVRAHLQSFRADEIAHRDDAAAQLELQVSPPSLVLRLWVWAVGAGSRVAVMICRRL
jgi:3-demethoxyubiquinol 3-hydroxylase